MTVDSMLKRAMPGLYQTVDAWKLLVTHSQFHKFIESLDWVHHPLGCLCRCLPQNLLLVPLMDDKVLKASRTSVAGMKLRAFWCECVQNNAIIKLKSCTFCHILTDGGNSIHVWLQGRQHRFSNKPFQSPILILPDSNLFTFIAVFATNTCSFFPFCLVIRHSQVNRQKYLLTHE